MRYLPCNRQKPLSLEPGRPGLRQLRKAGRFSRPTLCRAAVEEYRRDVNPARAFLPENFVAGLEYEALPCKQVYDAYVAWCLENGHRPLNSSNFGKEVKRTCRCFGYFGSGGFVLCVPAVLGNLNLYPKRETNLKTIGILIGHLGHADAAEQAAWFGHVYLPWSGLPTEVFCSWGAHNKHERRVYQMNGT